MKLIIDCLGGDNSPRANVEAAVLAMQKYPDLNLILTGGEKDILAELNRLGFTDTSRVEIVHAPDAITGDDKPTDAIRLKKESSMMKAISILRTDESVAGLIRSRWERREGTIRLEVEVPVNCTATIRAAGHEVRVGAGKHSFDW